MALAVVETAGDRLTAGISPGQPAVSVLVPTYQGVERLPHCLDSLAQQTLDPVRFEVVVVLNGPDDGSRAVVERFRDAHPHHRVRLVQLRETGLANARNVGLGAARGTYVTYLDDDDHLTPTWLEDMLDCAAPDVVVASLIGNLPEGAAPSDEPDTDTYVGRGLGPLAGRTVGATELITAFSYNNAKLLSTDLARRITYDTGLVSGEDHVYWLSLFAERPFRFRVLTGERSLYLRTVRPGSLGRQDPSYEFNVTQRLRCLRAIERVDRSDPAVAAVAVKLMRGQAWFINSYLRRVPEEHPRMVADAAALGLRDVPWAEVNRDLGRDLAICYCFPPDLDTSGMVAAKRLRERGLVTDVVSHDLSRVREPDPGALRLAAEVIGETHVVRGTASFSNWLAVPPFAESTWERVEAWEREKGPYRSVYSRAMAIGSHYAAALVKLRRPGITWVAEFSDPLDVNPQGEHRLGDVGDDWLSAELRAGMLAAGYQVEAHGEPTLRVFEWAERLTYALADRLVFTNEAQLETMLAHCGDPRLVERVRSIAEVQAHPAAPSRFYELGEDHLPADALPADVVHLAYFGVFYATRDLGDVVSALQRLTRHERARIRLHVFTSRPIDLAVKVVRAGLAGTVVARPFVPVLEFLALTRRFDVLVVDDAATAAHHARNPYLPSKVADYLGSGTAVWGICEEGSVMEGLPLAHVSRLGDVESSVRVLRDLVATGPGTRRDLT